MSQENPIETKELLRIVCDAAIERKSVDIKILNLEGKLSYSDYFVLCNGKASRQVRSIAENVLQTMKKEHDRLPLGVEGRGNDQWVVVDYGDVILHVFQPEMRSYYDLDGLWSDASIISLSDLGIEEPDAEMDSEPLVLSDDE